MAVYPAANPPFPNVRSVAVLRANAVGDFVLTLPALQALRDTYPEASIVLLGRRWHAEFLRGRDGPVDEVVEVPAVPGLTVGADAEVDPIAVDAFCMQMRRRRFDLAVQLHGGGRYSNPFLRRLGARITAGFQTPDAEPLDHNFPYVDDGHPVALRMLECVALAGATTADFLPRLAVRQEDLDEAHALVPSSVVPLVVMQPGATDPRRRWAPQNFARVGDQLARQGATVAINGAQDESEAAQVLALMHQPAIDLTGRLTLGGLTGLLSRAALLISNDTGPAHMARALDVPTVVIHWIGNLSAYRALSTRDHRVATSYRVHCPECGALCASFDCGHRSSFVDDVPVLEVMRYAHELLTRSHAVPGMSATAQKRA